ncbi:serine acetyltransferase [Francisella noatunensis]|uniref:Serine acetyltransferase n=1 Tax=Francisella noatunensis TaxID=657445 RepID=A0A9Q2KWJ3_9GAMM|nr:serine O-acetyltransferase EpsC [Francisella noatunensis]QOG55281.1 serine acetyltransferase [Francisella noatunensis subsp. noatunensis FSC774]MBK2028940.1 serine acetyltransferase [Francisella noatunensis]MBK2034552.1 serine acetyltransferase [Francisella noatunensis]MBK2048376.1 serine acetyltransferase [Francisella noatunensis]MBK2049728.1 serine acetyltransferase [Francisella noatunensis]
MIKLIRYYQQQDPAAPSTLETIFAYPGLHAILLHRPANLLWRCKLKFLGRLLSHITRFLTGIEIPPGATIGSYCFIDHGMGIVIGETAIVGNYVSLYHGVTLGSSGNPKLRHTKRHPTVEDEVIIGAGAKILGNITIGKHCRVSPNSVVMESMEPYTTALPIQTKIVHQSTQKN